VRGVRDVVEVAPYDDGMSASQVIGGHFGNEAHFLMDHFGAAAGGGVEIEDDQTAVWGFEQATTPVGDERALWD